MVHMIWNNLICDIYYFGIKDFVSPLSNETLLKIKIFHLSVPMLNYDSLLILSFYQCQVITM